MKAVILAGGVGSRLWPLSRELYPKQLLRLTGEHSLLQATILRAVNLAITDIIIVASHAHRFYVQEQIDELDLSPKIVVTILLEPVGRNTAPAIALAAMASKADEVLWVMPADHVLQDPNLAERLSTAQQLAFGGQLVTFGIVPKHAETGYGYIEQGDSIDGVDNAYRVSAFKEKPQLALAQQYVASQQYFWNSGMFCLQASVYLTALQQYRPDIHSACEKTFAARYIDLGFVKFPEEHFLLCKDESIDYAVMEHTDKAVVVPLTGKWSDIGSWNALYELEKKDQQGNVVIGDVVTQDTTDCFIHCSSRLVATVGLKDMTIVETPDALLIANRHHDQAIKQVVNRLKKESREERIAPRKIYRPWGHYEVLTKTDGFEVRLVSVKPDGKIGEHCHENLIKQWTVVSGKAEITVRGKTSVCCENNVITIASQSKHHLVNPNDEVLVIVELVQRSVMFVTEKGTF